MKLMLEHYYNSYCRSASFPDQSILESREITNYTVDEKGIATCYIDGEKVRCNTKDLYNGSGIVTHLTKRADLEGWRVRARKS